MYADLKLEKPEIPGDLPYVYPVTSFTGIDVF